LVSITWSHKIHEKQADIFIRSGKRWSVASIVATVLTVTGALGVISSCSILSQIATIVLACASLFLYIYTLAYDYSGKAAENKGAAKVFLALREEGRDLLAAVDAGVSYDEAAARYAKLSEKNQTACALAPRTEDRAVTEASNALSAGESTVTDRERANFCGNEGREA